jgi:bacillithiol system protein YtxJ
MSENKTNMSIFEKIFGSPKEESVENVFWTSIESMDQLNEIVKVSHQKPVAIFKHSTRCSISRMAWNQFQKEFNLIDAMALYYLDLLEYREISNKIETQFGVIHQSPQLIVVKDGNVVFISSHESIDAKQLAIFI